MSLLFRVGELLIHEALFLAGVSGKVDKMKTELQRMQRFLQDADNRQDEKEEVVRGWVSKIRELAYDAENVIETFILEIASRRQNGFSKKFKRYTTIFIEAAKIHKLGNAVEAILGRITSLTTSLTTYGIQTKNEPNCSTSIQQQLRRSYSYLVEEHTVGLDNDVKFLVKKLLAEKETDGVGHIVSICGMGGIGKTTLAKKLYHHVKIRDHFEAFAWCCVSQQFQPREVWEGILIKLVTPSKERREEISMLKDDEIAKELYLLQQKMKCLVVLDDIWREDAWDILKPGFPIGKAGAGSKMVMTTRNKAVATHKDPKAGASYADPKAFIYELQTLNEHDSWELFQTSALHSGLKYKTEMEKLGMEIVKKCAGLPLAIIVLGGLLATKDYPSEWEKVHKNVDLYLSRGIGTDQEYDVVNGVLALSYNELSYYLKPCFLHLGHFPEDYNIPCKALFRIWAAEGFVSHCQHNETMEDVAQRYLNELINRSIVQVSRMGSMGRVKTCRLHDVMRDFCLSKASQENYLEIVRTTNLNDKPMSNRVRRLVVHRDDNKDFDLEYYGRTPYLRSFFLFLSHTNWEYTVIKSRFSDFKLLRILSIEKCKIEKKMGNVIGGLIHLRYLAFEDCFIEALPSSIGNLRYLQTLIIRPSSLTTIVPNVVWKLEESRHLILGYWCDIEGGELLKLGNMRKLQILECGEVVNSSHLNSSCPQLLELSFHGTIRHGLPEWQNIPPNLTKLTLEECLLQEDPIPMLEKLPNLRILCLDWDSIEVNLLVCSSKGFPQLQSLLLRGLHGLEEWRVEEEAMPKLSQLHISHCNQLKMIPVGIVLITTLLRLKITSMPEEFEERVRVADEREGEDFFKVQHVPSIIIQQIHQLCDEILHWK